MPRTFERGRRASARRFFVGLKYISPLLLTIACLVFCALPVCQFDDGYEKRAAQSIFRITSESGARSAATLDDKSAEDVDLALARRLRPLPAVVGVIFGLAALGSLLLAGFSLAAFSMNPESDRCNLLKVRFKFIFPGRWAHFLLLFLPAIPTALPYYVASSFAEYYRVHGVTETQSGASMPEYYNYSVGFAGINPLVAAAVLTALCVILFIAVSGWERAYRMDMFTCYEAEKKENPRRQR